MNHKWIGFSLLCTVLLMSVLSLVVQAAPSPQTREGHPVVKEGSVVVEVMNTEDALNEALQLVDTFGGYVLRQRTWEQGNGYPYASVTIGVPAAEFEYLQQAFKELGTLIDERATGVDYSDEITDLQSRLANVRANQERVRSFFEFAKTVTETLDLNQELLQLEQEIGELQGRLNYLQDRAGNATLTLDIRPFIPTPMPIPTETPTPTPTPTPLPTAQAWSASHTAEVASLQLQNNARGVADFTLYGLIAWGPWLLIWGIVVFAVWRWRKQ